MFVFSLLLFAASLLAQESKINELRIVGEGEFLPSQLIDKSIIDANGNVSAGLLIQSDLSGFEYDANNGIVKINKRPGSDLLFLQEAERVVTIYKKNYKPLSIVLSDYGIDLQSGRVWKLEVTGDKISDQLISISIIRNIEESEVFIDENYIGKDVIHRLDPGRHTIRIEKLGYHPIIDTVNVTPDNILFTYELESIDPIKVQIKSNPANARIFIDNVDRGVTEFSSYLYPQKYSIRIVKNGYVDIIDTIEVKNNPDSLFSYNLVRNTAYLKVTKDPPDAELRIEGNPYNTDLIELIPGDYVIELNKPGYFPIRDSIKLVIADTLYKNYLLTKSAALLSITTIPTDATVLINKEDYSNKKSIELAPGLAKIEILKDGYSRQEETIEVKVGDRIYKEYILEKQLGILQVTVKPSDATVILYKNNQEIQSWTGLNRIKDLPIGDYELVAKSNRYKTSKEIIEINDGEITEVDLQLEESELSRMYPEFDRIESSSDFIKNVKISQDGDKANISYDAKGDLGEEIKLTLLLVSESNPAKERELNNVTGDIGEGEYIGRDRRITWHYTLEFPGGLKGDDYYLLLIAEKIESGGFPWLIVLGVAAGGAVAAVLAGGGGGDGGGSTINPGGDGDGSGFPDPPPPPHNTLFSIGIPIK